MMAMRVAETTVVKKTQTIEEAQWLPQWSAKTIDISYEFFRV
jgi:hypothetical protein